MLLVMCLFIFPAVCNARVWEETINNVTVRVKLTSGNISLSNAHNKIEISFGKLYEIGFDSVTQVGISGSTKHRFPSFNYQDFVEGPLEEIEVAGIDGIIDKDRNITAMRKIFKAKQNLVGPGAHFSFQIISFNNETILEDKHSQERYLVYNGTVQIIFTIGQWKFCEQDIICLNDGTRERGAFLDFYTYFEGKRKRVPVQRTNRGANIKGGSHPKTFDYGGADVTFSRKYRQNTTWQNFPRRYPLITGKEAVFRFARFPRHQTVVYNMFVNVSSDIYIPTSSSTKLTHSMVALVSIFLISFIW